MLTHYHPDSHRILRIVILIWIFLVILVLLPTRAHGQETLEPPLAIETIEDEPVVPELTDAFAAELLLLWLASICYLVLRAHWSTHPGSAPLPPTR